MTFWVMGSYAILNPYDAPYLLLKFVPLITNQPVIIIIITYAYMYALCITKFVQLLPLEILRD